MFIVVRQIRKIQLNFKWDGVLKREKYHGLNGRTYIKAKEQGVLSVRDIKRINLVVLGKWM